MNSILKQLKRLKMIRTTGFKNRKVFNARGNGDFHNYRSGDNRTFWLENGTISSFTHPEYYKLNILRRYSQKYGKTIRFK